MPTDNMTNHPPSALPEGHRLREYELARVLSHGDFSTVYLGYDHNLDREVAVKENLPMELAKRTTGHSVTLQKEEYRLGFVLGLAQFLRESDTLDQFDHPAIVRAYRFIREYGTTYIVMEYVKGETLASRLERQGTLSEYELKAILSPLLDGLAQVHAAGVLHRDVKPGNIMLRDEDNSPVLVDFGEAQRAIGERRPLAMAAVTPGYAPVEQYSSWERQGPWTDLYALGGVCYRALTGNAPEEATERERHDSLVPAVEAARGQAAPAFLQAVDWALQVNEDDRPQDVAAWRAALLGERVTPPALDVASPPSISQQFGRATALALALLLSAGAWLGWRTYQQGDVEKQASVAEDARQRAETEIQVAARQAVAEAWRQVGAEKRAAARQAVEDARRQLAAEMPVAGEKSKDLRRWRKLARGMSREHVTELLGEPDKVRGGLIEYWDYPHRGQVSFYTNEGVYGWEEPRM